MGKKTEKVILCHIKRGKTLTVVIEKVETNFCRPSGFIFDI